MSLYAPASNASGNFANHKIDTPECGNFVRFSGQLVFFGGQIVSFCGQIVSE